MGNRAGQFEVAVGNGATEVGAGHQLGLDLGREGLAPYDRARDSLVVREKGNTTHTGAGSISGPREACALRDDLQDARWARGNFVGHGTKISQELMNRLAEFETTIMLKWVTKGFLEKAEETPYARKCQRHGS